MKKSFLTLILAFTAILTFTLGLTACNKSDDGEKHVCAFNKQVKTQAYCLNNATCTEKAKYYYSCECGKMGEETFEDGEALGHLFKVYTPNSDGTCDSNGTKTAVCARNCGEIHTIQDENSTLGHNYTTWMYNGNGTHKKVCLNDKNHVIVEDCHGGTATETTRAICDDCFAEYGSFLGHTHVYDQKVKTQAYCLNNATCTEKAKYYFSCECGKMGEETFEDGEALGHLFKVYTPNNDATCEKNGTKTGSCSRNCGEVRTVVDTGTILGHDFSVYVSNNDATCESDGTKTAVCANNCGKSETVTDVGSMLGHSYGEWLYDSAKGHFQICNNDESHVVYAGNVIEDKVLYSANDKALDITSLNLALAKEDISISSLDEIDGYIVNNQTVSVLDLPVTVSGTSKNRAVTTAQTISIVIREKTILLTNVYAYTKIIDEAEDLHYFTLDGVRPYNEVDGYFILTKDIDAKNLKLKDHVFNNSNQSYPGNGYNVDVGFRGVLDGQGHTIDNLTVKTTGLFGNSNAPVIKNIAFTNATIGGQYPTLFAQGILRGKDYNNSFNGYEALISNVYVSIKSIAKASNCSRVGILINNLLPSTSRLENVIVDYSNVSDDIQTFISSGKSFYTFGSSGASMAKETSTYKNCYAISTAPVLSRSTMPGFAENQVEHTITSNVVTAVGKVLDEQVTTILGYHNKQLSVDHVIVGMRKYNDYSAMANDSAISEKLKNFNERYWSIINGVPRFKTAYYKDAHTYTEKIITPAALKSEASCGKNATYYYSCVCGAIGNVNSFEAVGTATLNHTYTEEVIKDEALKTQGEGDELSVYYKSCACGAVGDTEVFEIKTMVGKNVLIFGDSYSSYTGTIPEDWIYRVYYDGTNILSSPDQMWWNLLVEERGGTVVRNDSSSGSTIGYTGYSGNDYSNSYSFINRLEKLIQSGYFEQNQIDVVFVFGGTNDSWCGAELGEEMYEGWEKEDLYKVLPAITYFYNRLREVLPNAEIYGISNCVSVEDGDGGIKPEVSQAIKNACESVNGKAIILEDIHKQSNHPSETGMIQIKDQILEVFDKKE
ncbi:MAG: hypothetical protein IKJ14_02220 [Clostridia bacterium]|nr:hypothetical protein [Clostridia bacterium]